MRLTQTFQDPLLNLFMPYLTIMPPIFHMIQIFNGHFVLFAHFLKHVSFGLKAKTPERKLQVSGMMEKAQIYSLYWMCMPNGTTILYSHNLGLRDLTSCTGFPICLRTIWANP